MTQAKINKVEIADNVFSRLTEDTVQFYIDKKYEKKFVQDNFTPKRTAQRKRCKCPIPKRLDETDDDADEDDVHNEKLKKKTVKMQRCLRPQFPPALGNRIDICNGRFPKHPDELVREAKEGGIRPWHLILAIILTAIITALIVFFIVKLCCGEKNVSRAVSPTA